MDNGGEKSSRIRLNRYLAQCGMGSRRSAEGLIKAGKILVNGAKVTGLATTVDIDNDRIEYKGNVLEPVRMHEYFAYYKPRGTVVSRSDPQGRPTIFGDILKRTGRDLIYLTHVGRLDMDSEGLLLLTNDGDLVHACTHPRYHVKKVYQVRISSPLSDEDAVKMTKEGILSQGQTLRAGNVRKVPESEKRGLWYEVTLYEGKNRQVRRMFEFLSYEVFRLRRVQFAGIKLGTMKPGELYPLAQRTIQALKSIGFKVKNR